MLFSQTTLVQVLDWIALLSVLSENCVHALSIIAHCNSHINWYLCVLTRSVQASLFLSNDCLTGQLSQFLSTSNSAEKLDDVTETMILSFLAFKIWLLLRKRVPTPWYNDHTRSLKRAARKMERSWRKTKLEVFRIA